MLRFQKLLLYCGNLEKTVQKVFGNYNSHLQCGSYSRNNGHLEMSFSTVRYINLNFLHFRSDFFYGMYCRTEKLFSHVFIELIFKCISLIFWIIVLVLVFLFQLFLSFLHLYLWVLVEKLVETSTWVTWVPANQDRKKV